MSTIPLSDVKARLNKTLTVDDVELQDMLDAAEAYYADLFGAVGTSTLRYDGGPVIVLPVNTTAVTAVGYTDGTFVDLDDLDFDPASGLLRYPFTWGSRNLSVTFTTALPAHHREAILADVAGYFAATQRGGGTVAPRFPGEGYGEAYDSPGAPLTLFPRIAALAAQYPAIA